MKKTRTILLFFFLLCITYTTNVTFFIDQVNLLTNNMDTLSIDSPAPLIEGKSSTLQNINFQDLSYQINETYFKNINEHIKNFSNFGSRVTGYPGYNEAINYILDFFESQGLENVSTISYPLEVPIDYGTKIEFSGENYTAHALVPNSVNPCKANGLSGTVIYGGSGIYTDLDGKEIESSIVVLEFNSQDNWLNVASLGAKGVIFLAPNDTDRFEAGDKTIDIPLYFPRIYIDNTTTAETIRQLSQQGNQNITIYSDVEWVSIEAKNVMGLLPSDKSDDIIIISAHFDSSSVVPSLAPGADEACGIATLLELIRSMKDNAINPQKTIMFLALSGHNQAVAGAREFVYQNYEKLNKDSGIKLFLSLDLSASNNIIGINPYGYLYRFKLQFTTVNNLEGRMKDIGDGFLVNYASEIREETGYSFEVESYIRKQVFEDITPITFLGDQEPFVASNVIGLSLFTTKSHRSKFNTPFDLPDSLQLDHLKSQVVYSLIALSQLVNEPDLDNYLDLENLDFSLRHESHVGYGYIEGKCKEYNETEAWPSNVPNALIRVTSFDTRGGSFGVYSYITKTDEKGHYQIRGVSNSQPDYQYKFFVEAFVLDSEGNLIKGLNLGPRGQYFERSDKLSSKTITLNPTVFDCGAISFFRVSHPYTQFASADILDYQILNPETRNSFFSYGYVGAKSVSLVFLSPNTSSVMVGELPDGVLAVYATNSSSDALRGNGFKVKQGEFKNLGIAAFITSKDLQSMTKTYIDLYSEYNIDDPFVDETFQNASTLLRKANTLKDNFNYSESVVIINEGQTFAYDAFKKARKVIEDGTSTTIFFAVLLLPFSFALASLLFNFESGAKRVVVTSLIYVLTLLFFYIIHPGLHLSSNILMIILAIIAFLFVFPALFMIYQEGYDYLKSLRLKMIGSHFADTSRTSTILIAMSTGITRMKKRKGRTLIALSGIVLITFSLTLFTSASTQVTFFSRGSEIPTDYNGVYFRTKDWTAPLSEQLLDNLQTQYGNDTKISSRWWLYPPSTKDNGYVMITDVNRSKSWDDGEAILGLTSEEPDFLPVTSALLAGGRWFSSSSSMECILPEKAANNLNVEVNDGVIWGGSEFIVVGIINGATFNNLKDFDEEGITPKDLSAPSPYIHLEARQIIILPAYTAKNFGASLYSISILTDDETSTDIAESVSATYGRYLEVLVGQDNIVTTHKRVLQSLGRGLVEMGIPLTIAILLMVNTSISTVYESKKEINTFTSLGLAPFHIAGLFLAEFLVYAVIGSVIGYLGGITTAVMLSELGLFPETLAINYSSSSVINALGFGIGGILLSTIYPLRISAKMSVPSVKRAWELKTAPEADGNKWNIPLPFVTATEQEAEGIIEFLREYFVIYESESVGGVFFAQDINVTETDDLRREKHLLATVNLAPFDMGLKQTVDLYTYFDEVKYRYTFEIDLERLEGLLSAWKSSVRRFVDSIRKQLLIWRSLPKDEKANKAKQFKTKVSK